MKLTRLLYPDVVIPAITAVAVIWMVVICVRDFPKHKGAEAMAENYEDRKVELSLTLTTSVRVRGATGTLTRATTTQTALSDQNTGASIRKAIVDLADRGSREISVDVLNDVVRALQEANDDRP
jgi:hypothetical protein